MFLPVPPQIRRKEDSRGRLKREQGSRSYVKRFLNTRWRTHDLIQLVVFWWKELKIDRFIQFVGR